MTTLPTVRASYIIPTEYTSWKAPTLLLSYSYMHTPQIGIDMQSERMQLFAAHNEATILLLILRKRVPLSIHVHSKLLYPVYPTQHSTAVVGFTRERTPDTFL